MEVLGVASGLAGLISLADVIALRISKYYTLVKGSQSEIRALLIEVQSLYGVLNSLKLLATCLEDGQQPLQPSQIQRLDHFQTCRQNLHCVKKSLSKLDLDASTKLSVLKIKLLWPFKGTETNALVERIARNKRDLADALTADGLTALLNALSTQGSLIETVQDVQMRLQKMAEEKGEDEHDERKKTVFQWCSVVTPYEKHRNSKSLRHPNTVLWFFDSPEFKKWSSEPNSSIWLYGIPGAGKTILTSAIIEEEKRLASKTPDYAIAYFYVEYRLPDTQIPTNILGSLIRQLCASSEDAYEVLEAFYRECNPTKKPPVLPTSEQLGKLLSRLSGCFECVAIVIDGLDEISDALERSLILHLLSTLSSPDLGSIKVVYTSRDEIDIRRNFEAFAGMSIAARSNDLELYVAAVVELRIGSRSLRLRDPALKEMIIDGIVSKANGMFQWAKCQIDYLCTLSTDKERRHALETLPTDLFETYMRILDRVANPGNRKMVERTLRWIDRAVFPLHIDTIATAVAVEIGSISMEEDDIPDPDSILRWCSSLVTKNEKTGILSFSHFTVEEFLKDEKLLATPGHRNFYLNESASEEIIAKACLTYLQFQEFRKWDLRDSKALLEKASEFPLLKYSCQSWPSHAREFKNDEFERDKFEKDKMYANLLQRLFSPQKSSNFILWLYIYWPACNPYGLEVPKTASTLHIAIILRLVRTCEWLLKERGCDANLEDDVLGPPLKWAIKGNKDKDFVAKAKLVRLLLDHGANGNVIFSETVDDPDLPRIVTRTPMSLALDIAPADVECSCAIFKHLFDTGHVAYFADSVIWTSYLSDKSPRSSPSRTHRFSGEMPSAEVAGSRRDSDSSASLLSSDSDDESSQQSDSGEMPSETILAMFREILDHPNSNLLDQDSRGKMVIHIATHGNLVSDHELMTSTLVRGEDPSDIPSWTTECAVAAVENGQTHVISRYIEMGFEPRILYDCIPVATESGQTSMVHILLNYCPHVNTKIAGVIKKSWVLAVKGGRRHVLQEFLHYGVDINMVIAIDDQNLLVRKGPAISFAILYGHLEAVGLLLNVPDVDLDILSDGLNLLHLALRANIRRAEIVDLVLSKGVSPLAVQVGKEELSTLHMLLGSNNPLGNHDIEILRRLNAAGCSLKGVDKSGNSLLHAVLERFEAQEEIIRLLNEDGILKSLPNVAGELPLQVAVRRRAPSEVIRMLIPEHTSCWNSSDVQVFSVLHSAVYSRSTVSEPIPKRCSEACPQMHRPFFHPAPPPPPPPPPISWHELNEMLRVLGVLLETDGIDVNVLDALGSSPLLDFTNTCDDRMSSELGVKIIRRLLSRGANVDHRNRGQWTALHRVASKGFASGVEEIFKFDPNLNLLNDNGYTPLHQAIFRGRSSCVRLWLDKSNSSNPRSEDFVTALETRTSDGLLPLHVAALHNQVDIILLMHDTGRLGDINASTTVEKLSPLHLAAVTNHIATMEILIRYGAELNAKAADGNTPLHLAAERGAVDSARYLIEKRAIASLENGYGMTPWMVADEKGHQRMKFALEIAARHEAQARTTDIDSGELVLTSHSSRSKDEQALSLDSLFTMTGSKRNPSSILDAFKSGSESIILGFLATGSDLAAPIGIQGRTPLHFASVRGYLKVAEKLLADGASVDVEDYSGEEPLHLAAAFGRTDVAQLLFDHGANLSARNIVMRTPLHLAAWNGHLDVIKMLLTASEITVRTEEANGKLAMNRNEPNGKFPHLEFRDKHGCTPLLASIIRGHTELATFLVGQGANIHAVDINGDGAMLLAGYAADKALVELLLSRGLNVHEVDIYGKTALCCVLDCKTQSEETTALALFLIECGTSVSPKPPFDVSPLVLACNAGNVSVVEELMKRMTMEEINTSSMTLGTPLFSAAFRGRSEIVKILLEAGADFEVAHIGETPVEAAFKEGHRDVVAVFETFFEEQKRHGNADRNEEAERGNPNGPSLGSTSSVENLGSGPGIEF